MDSFEGWQLVSSLWVSDPPSVAVAQPAVHSPALTVTGIPGSATAAPDPRPASPASPIAIRPLGAAPVQPAVAADAAIASSPPPTAPAGIVLAMTEAPSPEVPAGLMAGSRARPGPSPAPNHQPGIAPGAIRPLTAAPAPSKSNAPSSPRIAATATPASTAPPAVVAASALPTMAPYAPDNGSGVSLQPFASSGGSTTPTLSAALTSLIGGQEVVKLTAPSGKQLSSVTWQISGAELSQSYTNAQGTTTDLPNPYPLNAGGASTSLTIYWNASDGNHTIAATAKYTDGTSGPAAPLTVSVLKPTVSKFTIDYTPYVWGPVTGKTTDGFSFKMTYNATVALPQNPSSSANFGFIQKVMWSETQNNAVSGQHTIDTHTINRDGYVLDNVPEMPYPGDPGYLLNNWTSPLMSGSTPVSTPAAPNQLADVPYATYSQKKGVANDTSLDINITGEYTTTLVYRPNPGIWVGLSSAPALQVTGHVTYDPATQKWKTVSVEPQTGDTLTGAANQAFVTWTGYYAGTNGAKWDPPYTP